MNDRLGRPAGDEALRQVGLLLESTKRSWDVAARVGGEEFALLAPDTDEHGAYILAERARAAIEETFEGPDLAPLTASFGVVSFPCTARPARRCCRRPTRPCTPPSGWVATAR